MDPKKSEFNPQASFKSHILYQDKTNPVKLIINNYSDSYLFIITQKNKMGSFIEVERDNGELDVKLLNGTSKRNEKYEEVARTLAEILFADPIKILGIENEQLVKIFTARTGKKQIMFNMCFNFKNMGQDGELADESDEEMLQGLYKEWRSFWSQEQNLAILCK